MTQSPLHTVLCERLDIEYPVVAFTHCKDVAMAVINAGGFAVLGEGLHTLLSADYIQGSLDYQRKDLMTEAAGQGVDYVTEMKPARQVLSDLIDEALDTLERLGARI